MAYLDLLELDPDLKELPSAMATEVIPGSTVRPLERPRTNGEDLMREEGGIDYRNQSTQSF